MTSAVAKVVMVAMKRNNHAIIKAMAQRMRMSRGKLVSQAKKINRKTKSKPPMSNKEKAARARLGQNA